MGTNLTDKTLFRLNDAVMGVNTKIAMERDPKLHIGLNPLLLTMRQELHTLNFMSNCVRKRKLKELLKTDNIREDEELREVNLAYTNTQI